MSLDIQQPRTPAEQWKQDIDPLIDKLLHSGDRSLHGKDSLAWMFHIVGRLQSGRFDRIDLAHIISTFLVQADELLTLCRFYFQECLISLLLLKYTPAAGSQNRNEWKNRLAHNRLRIDNLIHENASIKPFITAMIRYAFPVAKANVASTLTHCLFITDENRRYKVLAEQLPFGNWSDRIDDECPWSDEEIIGYPCYEPDSELTDTRALPFEEPDSAG